MDSNKKNVRKFNFMDLLIILTAMTFISAAVYYVITGMKSEKKIYKVAYTMKLELNASDADKISVGDSVLSSDGETVIGTVSSVKIEKAVEYVIDRRVTAPTAASTTLNDTAAVITETETETETQTETENNADAETTDEGELEVSTEADYAETTTEVTIAETTPQPQVIIVPGKNYGVRTGDLLTYKESEDKIIMFVTVIADVKAADNAYIIDGSTVKNGKKAVLLTPYFYAEGEYEDISSSD